MKRQRAIVALAALTAIAACTNVVPADLEARLNAERSAKELYQRAVRELWVLETTRGALVVRLFPDAAPQTVAQVRAWTAAKAYDGTWIHRVVREPRPFVIQAGDPESRGLGAITSETAAMAAAADLGFGTTDPVLPPEPTTRRHMPGAVALAVSADGTRAGPQFVIALADLKHLDGVEPVFGQVEGGWSVVEALRVGDRILRARLVNPEDITGEWLSDVPRGANP